MVDSRQTIVAGVTVSLGLGLAIGLTLTGHGVYLAVKANLAQVLLDFAWDRTRQSGVPHRPWFWADTHPVARLIVPDHGVDLIVLAGSSGRTLAFGPRHVPGTARPGEGGLSMVSGHRDTHFAFLANLHAGEELFIETDHGTHRYVIDRTLVLDLQHQEFSADPMADRLVLVTCYPFRQWTAGGSQRYIAVAVSKGPDTDASALER